jgi:DNA-binding MltR family transcriptional regulator
LKPTSSSKVEANRLASQIALDKVRRHAHSGFALFGASVVEENLRRKVLAAMRPLSKKMVDRLFGGYGPLSTFSALADVSYAMGCIDKATYEKIGLVRRIRNEFAHSLTIRSFDEPAIRQMLSEATAVSGDRADPQKQFIDLVLEIVSELQKQKVAPRV